MQRVRAGDMALLRQRADYLGALPSVLAGCYEREPSPSEDIREN